MSRSTAADAFVAAVSRGAPLYWWHRRLLEHLADWPGQTKPQLTSNAKHILGPTPGVVDQLIDGGAVVVENGRLYLPVAS